MIEKLAITDLLKQISSLLPDSASDVRTDLEQKLRPILEAGFRKLDLVSREEFDCQLEKLDRLSEHTCALEAEIKQLTEAKPVN